MHTLVIIPTYNERDNLVSLARAVLAVQPGAEVLIVDDNSPDGTGRLADGLAAQDPRVHVLHRTRKEGLGAAYVAGFRWALAREYDALVEMDADFSHRPEDLPRLLRALGGADVVIGSRNVPGGRTAGWSLLRRLVSRGGSLYARLFLRLPVHDCTSGFKAFRREVVAALDLHRLRANGYGFQVEVNYACYRAGCRIIEVPIVFPDRTRGASKMTGRIVVEAALLVLALRLGLRPAALIARPASAAAASTGAPPPATE